MWRRSVFRLLFRFSRKTKQTNFRSVISILINSARKHFRRFAFFFFVFRDSFLSWLFTLWVRERKGKNRFVCSKTKFHFQPATQTKSTCSLFFFFCCIRNYSIMRFSLWCSRRPGCETRFGVSVSIFNDLFSPAFQRYFWARFPVVCHLYALFLSFYSYFCPLDFRLFFFPTLNSHFQLFCFHLFIHIFSISLHLLLISSYK